MRSLALGAALAWVCLSVGIEPAADPKASLSSSEGGSLAVAAPGAPSHPLPLAPATLTQVVTQYCVVCHNDQMRTGNLSLASFDVEQAAERAETSEKMIRKLRAGMMPPPGMPRPAGDTLLALVTTLESKVDDAARTHAANVGTRRFQRLSRAEYERVIHDLLDLDVDAEKWLPRDVVLGSFDNQSAAQPFSPTLLDSFLRAATEISRLAVGNPAAPSSTTKYLNSDRVSQHAWDRLEGAPFGSRGGIVVTHDFPADGQYVFQVQIGNGTGNNVAQEDLDLSIDGESVATLKLEHNGGSTTTHQTEPIPVKAGQHKLAAAFVNIVEGPYDDRFGPPASSATSRGGVGTTMLTHLKELWITGPTNVAGVSDTPSRARVFTCHPRAPEEERSCAKTILTGLAERAYRRAVAEEAVTELMRLYDQGFAKGGFEVGVRTGLQAILMSPDFLFRLERVPEGARGAQEYRLSDDDLASRLSFFLWATSPDQELLEVARAGRLSDPAVLQRQVQRMLDDPRSEALATRFAHQWLRLQDVGQVWPQADLYPDFSAQLAEAMVRETQLLFQHLVRENLSALELLGADYTFLNERLAKHYGIDGVYGEEFRLVRYPDKSRRGIFGHGSVLQLTSLGGRTSPVLRGKWVMEVVIGTPPPPPPPNVPPFDASPSSAGGRLLTTRERMEMHRAAPLCNSCHRFMDPIGLALDNLDVTGQWRIRENMVPLDTRGALYDGTPVSSPSELADALLKRPIPLMRNFTEQMLSYAIGRPLDYQDQPTVRAIARASEQKNYRMRDLVLGVVRSEPFQMRQMQSTSY